MPASTLADISLAVRPAGRYRTSMFMYCTITFFGTDDWASDRAADGGVLGRIAADPRGYGAGIRRARHTAPGPGEHLRVAGDPASRPRLRPGRQPRLGGARAGA